MIQEYYLHMFCGVNGEHDQTTGAGRLAIAALMSGFGLVASTKKDLQTRVDWRTTPGCFLGQKELTSTDYYLRNYPETRFASELVQFRKVNRSMNYQLDWSVVNGTWSYKPTSPIWINIAKIYWLGYFLFGRNVIPEATLASLRERFDFHCDDNGDQRRNLKCHYVMQFMKNIGLPLDQIRPQHLFKESQEDLPRHKVFASLAIAMNWSENSTGFYAAGALIPVLLSPGTPMGEVSGPFSEFTAGRAGRFPSGSFPLTTPYYHTYGLGRPAIPNSTNRVPSHGRDLVPLLFCNLNRTPAEEASTQYAQVRGSGFNTEYLKANRVAWMTGAILWEYHLMLTGEALFPLRFLEEARVEKGWTPEELIEHLIYLSPCNNKNSSVSQIVRFNLDRQLQV